MTNKDFVNNCWQLVQHQYSIVYVIEIFGELKAFVGGTFVCKGRDIFKNDLRNCKDVTDFVLSSSFPTMVLNELSYQVMLESLPTISISFGHDNFIELNTFQKPIQNGLSGR